MSTASGSAEPDAPLAARTRAAVEAIHRLSPDVCVIVAGSAGTGEETAEVGGTNHSDLEIAVVGGVRALLTARRARRELAGVEAYWVAPWRLRWGLKRN